MAFMWKQGQKLLDGYREMVARLGIENARIGGIGPMPYFGLSTDSDDEKQQRFHKTFYEATLDGGLYLPEDISGSCQCRTPMKTLRRRLRFLKMPLNAPRLHSKLSSIRVASTARSYKKMGYSGQFKGTLNNSYSSFWSKQSNSILVNNSTASRGFSYGKSHTSQRTFHC